ncbi:MAG: response regulator, partial [Planctomycetes bacterium]|nr:response regulator [Planctomycetota bacterium]
LLVDDDNVVRMVIAQVLEHAGFMVSQAVNGVEALEVIKIYPPDLIVTDLCMPLMDGFSSVIQLQRSVLYCDIPIILLTGACDEKVEARAQVLGIKKVIAKVSGPKAIQKQAMLLLSAGS